MIADLALNSPRRHLHSIAELNPSFFVNHRLFRSKTFLLLALLLGGLANPIATRAEAMLQLYNVTWSELIQKMPEIAEAGYDSIWLPPPAKGGSVYSIGYDLFDPFDLGDKNQRGTVATHWGTKEQLVQAVQMAHRFGLRIYFDNVMNHRAFDVPGYNSSTPTNLYPGLLPQDFHLQTVGDHFQNWPSVEDYGNQWDVQYESLSGLIDLATEPGSINGNFGPTLGSTTPKLSFVRQPGQNSLYMVTNQPAIAGSPWRPFNGTNGVPQAEDVNSYLIRAVLYTLNETKCDGFRLDAVKHVPSAFFGDTTASWNGYCGAIQAMFDYVHGYGANVLGNGYDESDDSRNSCFDTEAPRNDALIFGEHLGEPPTYGEYIARGMRLLNSPLRDRMNSALGGDSSLSGLDQRSFGAISPVQSVMFAQSHDASGCCATHRDLQNAYYFLHEGIGNIYSDNYNQSGAPSYFPTPPYANYLGEFNDGAMPDICYVHHQLARGGTWPRWSDQNIAAFERYDYRESASAPDQDVVLFVMNDKYSYPGDISFDDGVAQTTDGYYGVASNGSTAVSNSRGVGMVVGFPPGSVLAQLSSSTPGAERAFKKLLVHGATANLAAAQASANDPNPVNRLIYVGGQSLAPGGGAVELIVPGGGWVMYGYQWPEASRASLSDAISFQQGGAEVPRVTVYRHDGYSGDSNFNPAYPFKMRGSVDQFGNVVGGVNVSNRTYTIDIPVLSNAPFDILVRSDASADNTLIKLDGGLDINSQMGLGPTSGSDLRDNKPGSATDVYLGYEQTTFQFRNGPEKFASSSIASNNLVSLGAETYCYTVGGATSVVAGAGFGRNITNYTASWVYHDPAEINTALAPNNSATQRVPLAPAAGQSADIYVQVGYQFQINTCFIYYTTDGTNPEGAFGVSKGTTHVVQASFLNADSAQSNIDWWKGTIPAQPNGTPVRYKVALFNGGSGGSLYAGSSIQPISDAEFSGAKLYGLNQAAITNFNPATARVWLHNDRNPANTITGLQSGFHIVRARTFLPRANKSAVFNTFSQTFYYAGDLPTGVIAFPAPNATVASGSYTVVVRAGSSVTDADFNIEDSNPLNDDSATGQSNGNGSGAFAPAIKVNPDPSLTAQYPEYPLEFRFVYTNVPSSGTAAITVRLKDFATSVYPDRMTLLTNTVNTAAPTQVLEFSSPGADGSVLTLSSNSTYLVQACFSSTLASAVTNFTFYINGVLQPPSSYILRPADAVAGCPGMKSFLYNWTGATIGTNVLELFYTNSVALNTTRTVIVAPRLKISGLANNNQLVIWDSAPGVNYQVLATTNLALPFQPISPIIQGGGSSTFFYDTAPADQKFYEIVTLP